MRRIIYNQNLFLSIAACFLLFLSTVQIVSVICVIALVIYWLASGSFKNSLNALLKEPLLLLLLGYYALHAVSLVYSSNLSYALFDLQVKLPFLIFPLILAGHVFTE